MGCQAVRAGLYGGSDSPLHEGPGTDRLVVHWQLDDRRVEHRLAGPSSPPTLADVTDVAVINPVRMAEGVIACDDARTDLDAERLLLAIPVSMQRVSAADPVLVTHWRAVVRAGFEAYLRRGWQVGDVVRGGEWSAYVFERG